MKIENWFRKRWAVIVIAVFFLMTWIVVTRIRHTAENGTRSMDARLQMILQAEAVLLGRMDEAERAKDKQGYMQLLKAYIEKQNEYEKILPDLSASASKLPQIQAAGFSEEEKLSLLASEYSLSIETIKNLRSQMEIMFRETPASEDQDLEKFLKSK